MIKFSVVRVGQGAIARCARCGGPAPVEYRPVQGILAEIRTMAATWAGGPGPNVTLRGPEPLEHPGIEAVLGALRESGVERVCVYTGGAPFTSQQACVRAFGAGVNHVRTVLLAGDAATHDALSGVPGSWDAAMEGMAMLSRTADETGVHLMLCGLLPVCAHNLEELPQAVVAFAHAGIRSVALDVGGLHSDARAASWITAAVDTGMVDGVWVSPVGEDAASFVPQSEWALCPVELCEATTS